MEKIHFNYDKLKGAIREYWKTQSEYAKFLGISEASLYEKFNSESYFNQPQMIKTMSYINEDLLKINEYFFIEKVEKNTTV